MVLATVGVFHFLHRDDLFLHEVTMAERPITEEEVERVESIYNNTLAQNTKYIVPSNSSLVNVLGLDSAVQAVSKPSDGQSPAATGPAGRSI